MTEIGIATNKKLIDIYNMLVEGSLVLAPAFQRSLVWSMPHKEAFIETILLGLPFPEVYFADGKIDLETKKSQTLVVDGQQRLHTIYEYVSASEKLQFTRIRSFKQLDDKEQTAFFDYKIVIRDLGRLEDERIREVFRRINSVQYALNAVEFQNALYEGAFIQTAKEIAKDLQGLEDTELFNEGEISRMLDVQFVLLLMTTIEVGGYFPFSKEVETYIKANDDNYPNQDSIKERLRALIDLYRRADIPADSIFQRRTSFFSLVVELDSIWKARGGELPDAKRLRDTLATFEGDLMQNRSNDPDNNELAAYYHYLYQSTGSKKGRTTRGEVLRKYVGGAFGNAPLP